MSFIYLRPTSTVSNNGGDPSTGSDIDALISDEDDATWVQWAIGGDTGEFELDNITLPAGAVVTQVSFGVRAASMDAFGYGGTTAVNFVLYVPGTIFSQSGYLPVGPAMGQYQFLGGDNLESLGELSDANLDALRIFIAPSYAVAGSPLAVRFAELYVYVQYVEQPALTVDAPTGTVDDTTQPTVSWTPDLDGQGGAQSQFEVKIFDDATYGGGGFDPVTSTPDVESGVIRSSSVSWTSPAEALDNLDTYRAYVRISQFANGAERWSDWEFSGFDVDVDTPNAPQLLLIGDSAQGRVNIEIEDADTALSTATDAVELQRSVDGGVTWKFIRLEQTDTHIVYVGDPIDISDYEAPEGIAVQYRARAAHDYSGVWAAGAWTTRSVQWNVDGRVVWLKAPLRPELNIAVEPITMGDFDRDVEQGVFDVLGRSDPVVITGARRTPRGEIVFSVALAQRDRVRAILANSGPTLIQARFEDDWEDRYVAVGSYKETREMDKAKNRRTVFTVPWREVIPPVVTTQQGEPPVIVEPPPVTPPGTPAFAAGFPRWENALGNHIASASVGDTVYFAYGPRTNLQGVSYVSLNVWNGPVFRQIEEGTTLDNIDRSYVVQALDNNETIVGRGQINTLGGNLIYNETLYPTAELSISDVVTIVTPTVVAETSNSDNTVSQLDLAVDVPSASNKLLAVEVYLTGTNTPTVVEWNGVDITPPEIDEQSPTVLVATSRSTYVYFVLAPETGSGTVHVEASGTGTIIIQAQVIADVEQTAPFGTGDTDGAGGQATTFSTSVDTDDTDLVLSASVVRSGADAVAGAGEVTVASWFEGNAYSLVTTKPGDGGFVTASRVMSPSDYGALISIPLKGSEGTVIPPGGGGGGGGGVTGPLSALLAYDMVLQNGEVPTPMNPGFGQAYGARYAGGVNSFRSGSVNWITAWLTAFEIPASQGTVGTNASPAYIQVVDPQCWVDDEVLGWVRVQYSNVPQLFVYFDAYTTGTTETSIPSGEQKNSPAGGGRAIHIGAPNGVNGLSRSGSVNNLGWTWHTFPDSQTALYGSGAPAQGARMRAVIFACRARIVDRNAVALGQPGCVTADITSAQYSMQMGGDGRLNSPSSPPPFDICIANPRRITSDFRVYTANDMRQVLHSAQVDGIPITGVLSAAEYTHS